MVIILKENITHRERENLDLFLKQNKLKVHEIVGEEETILGAIGSVKIDPKIVMALPGVKEVIPITKSYKLASREFKKEDSFFTVGSVPIGGNRIVVISGPCAVESREQILESARITRKGGAVILRAGAYKPRTSPYSFQGLGETGLQYLKEAGEAHGMPVVSEIVSPSHIDIMKEYVDVLQIGARNMQNFELLKVAGKSGMPVILKRGLAATYEEWLMAAEYLLDSGTDKIILCERGIRTFEDYTRNTLDIAAIPVVNRLSHLPVFVDPSHGTGIREKVLPMSLAAVAAGAHGLLIETHPNPEKALSDGPQSLHPEELESLVCDVETIATVVKKEVVRLSQPTSVPCIDTSTTSNTMNVAFQGETGAYSEEALFTYFKDKEVSSLPCLSFHELFSSVLDGRAEYGIVPLENTLAGSIVENYDLLSRNPDITMVGEVKIRVRHNLIAFPGTPLGEIKEVFSHPQALAQCEKFLKENNLKGHAADDTAGSVREIKNEGKKWRAAIAGHRAADVNSMAILKEGIETNPHNYTRFGLITRQKGEKIPNADKASLSFILKSHVGSLAEPLSLFADFGLDMTKLESRPIHGEPWNYRFYVDVTLPEEAENLDRAIEKARPTLVELREIGRYRGVR